MSYMPLRPTAGNIFFRLTNRSTGAIVKDFSLYVFDYSDNMLDSNNNEILNSIGNQAIDDYYGVRPNIKFTVVNSTKTAEYRQKILWLMAMINDINNSPETYRLIIFYRYPDLHYVINDAIQVGSIPIIEFSESSNVAQGISLEFIDKSTVMSLDGYNQIYPTTDIVTDYCSSSIDIWSQDTFYTYLGSGSITNMANYIPSTFGDNVNLIVARNYVNNSTQLLITPSMNECLILSMSANFTLCLANKPGFEWKYSINGVSYTEPAAIISQASKRVLTITGRFGANAELMYSHNAGTRIVSMYGNKSDNYYGFASGLRYLSNQANLTSLKVRSLCAAFSANDRFYVENNDAPALAFGEIVTSHYWYGNSTSEIEIHGIQIYNLPVGDSVAQTKAKVSVINSNAVARYGVV